VNANVSAGTALNNTGSFDTTENNPVSDTVTTSLLVPTVLGATTVPNLSITKTVNVASAKRGQTVKYTIVVKNTGDEPLSNVVVKDILPLSLSFLHSSSTSMSWNLGSLDIGKSKSFVVEAKVKSGTAKGKYVNIATATATDVAEHQAKASLNVVMPTVLGLATTGVGALDYSIFLFGALLVMAGFVLIYSRRTTLGTGQK
jgi:uncharacterized repeat protein (TIGR01451 family)